MSTSPSAQSHDPEPSPVRLRCTITDHHGDTTIHITDTITAEARALVAPIIAALTPLELDALFCLLLRRVTEQVRAA